MPMVWDILPLLWHHCNIQNLLQLSPYLLIVFLWSNLFLKQSEGFVFRIQLVFQLGDLRENLLDLILVNGLPHWHLEDLNDILDK